MLSLKPAISFYVLGGSCRCVFGVLVSHALFIMAAVVCRVGVCTDQSLFVGLSGLWWGMRTRARAQQRIGRFVDRRRIHSLILSIIPA